MELDTTRQGSRRRRWPATRQTRGLAAIHPLAALLCVLVYVAAGLAVGNPLQLAVLLAILLLAFAVAGKLAAVWRLLRFGLPVAVVLIVINALVSGGGVDVLWEASLGPFTLRLTVQGIAFGLGTALRLFVVMAAFALYVVVLDQDEQLALISRLSFRSGLVASLATRMFPVLSADAARISEAQRARGVELDRGRRRDRARARVPLLGALLRRSLERAMDVAEAMDARGYGRHGRRDWRRDRRWRPADLCVAAASIVALAALIAGIFTDGFSYGYFPLLDDPLPGMVAPAWLIMALCLLVAAVLAPWARALARRHGARGGAGPAGQPARATSIGGSG